MPYRVELGLAAIDSEYAERLADKVIDSTLSGLPAKDRTPAAIRYILERARERVLFRPIEQTNAGERQLRGINIEISVSDISQEAKGDGSNDI